MEDLNVALPLHMVAQQNAVPLGTGNQVVGNGRGNLAALGKGRARSDRDADIGVCGRLVDDDVGIHQRLGIACLHRTKQLANAHLTTSPRHFGDVIKHIVALPPANHVARGATATLGHIVHDFGFEQFDITVLNAGHCTLVLVLKPSSAAAWRHRGWCWQAALAC